MINLIQAEIGYIPLERDMNGNVTKATLIEVSISPQDYLKIMQSDERKAQAEINDVPELLTKDYMRNPVVTRMFNTALPPAGKVTKLVKTAKGLKADIEFPPQDL